MPKFVNWNRRSHFNPEREDFHYLRTSLGLKDRFTFDISQPIASGGTVTFATLQIAYYMGFKTAILIGLDHSFQAKGIPNQPVVRDQEHDQDHFHPDYFPKGITWQPPDLLRSEIAYQLAREAFEAEGREIIDATDGGRCQVFQKREYGSLFPGSSAQELL